MKYRKKPVVIEAMQWTGTNRIEIARWILPPENFPLDNPLLYPGNHIYIETLEGTMSANIDDWIIKGVKGEFYPIKDEIFRETYEAVDAT